jgi:hypothetical protein
MAAVYVRKHPNPKSKVCEASSTTYQLDDGSPRQERDFRKPSGRGAWLLSTLENKTKLCQASSTTYQVPARGRRNALRRSRRLMSRSESIPIPN